MDHRRIIVIGSSAGGIQALILLVSTLPNSFVAPMYVAQHLAPTKESILPAILTRSGRLPVLHARSGMALQGGTIFLAPPGHNMSLSVEGVTVTPTPLQRPSPSIDLLFESAALRYGSHIIGVILTGQLSDGTMGMQAIKRMGGTTIIQNPLEALYPSMPQSVQDACPIDYCLPLEQIGARLHLLTR